MAKKSAASKGYRRQNVKKPFLTKREIIIVCAIAAVVIAGFILLLNYDDGALKVVNGAVVTDGDNWLITNGAAAQNNVRYFKVGEAGDIEGYARASQSGLYGDNTPEYVYTPEDEGDPVDSVSVFTYPAKAERLAEYYAGLLTGGEGVSVEVSDMQTSEVGGTTCIYYIYTTEVIAAEDAAAENTASKNVSAYIDTIRDSSIVVNVSDSAATPDDCLSDEALLAVLDQVVASIKLETGK